MCKCSAESGGQRRAHPDHKPPGLACSMRCKYFVAASWSLQLHHYISSKLWLTGYLQDFSHLLPARPTHAELPPKDGVNDCLSSAGEQNEISSLIELRASWSLQLHHYISSKLWLTGYLQDFSHLLPARPTHAELPPKDGVNDCLSSAGEENKFRASWSLQLHHYISSKFWLTGYLQDFSHLLPARPTHAELPPKDGVTDCLSSAGEEHEISSLIEFRASWSLQLHHYI